MSILVGKKAPDFCAPAVVDGNIVNNFKLSQFFGKKYILLFFYPHDFTFVCPTEIVAFQKALPEFENRGVQVVGCSIDSAYSHFAWINTPREKGGISGVTYPLVGDVNKTISSAYGVLAGSLSADASGNLVADGQLIAYRGLFLIDRGGIVRHEVVNDFPLGRSTAEEIRMVDALQHFEQFGEVCPMDWHKGESAIKPTSGDVGRYLSSK